MNLSLIILLIALIATISLFGFRFYEFHSGKLLISRELRLRIESSVTGFYKKIISTVLRYYHKTAHFLKELPTIMAHVMHFYWRKFSKKVDDFFLKIRNKK